MSKAKTIDYLCKKPEGSFKKFIEVQDQKESLQSLPVSAETKQAIVDLWLAGEENEARLILQAFKIGLNEGRRTHP